MLHIIWGAIRELGGRGYGGVTSLVATLPAVDASSVQVETYPTLGRTSSLLLKLQQLSKKITLCPT
jgi:hypothetical protein